MHVLKSCLVPLDLILSLPTAIKGNLHASQVLEKILLAHTF
jgi:hypothetical protein